MNIKALSWVTLALLTAGCNRPGTVSGDINGESFGKVVEAIYVDASTDVFEQYKFMIASFPHACSNYNYYVQTGQYDTDQTFETEEEMDPHFLYFIWNGEADTLVGEHEILPQGEFYPGTFYSTSGRYHEADGAGLFDTLWMDGGLFTVEAFEAGAEVSGTFDITFTNGDAADGKFKATYCEP